jgi:hypothetical protein
MESNGSKPLVYARGSFQRSHDRAKGYPDAAALLSRYNVAQLQACLYRAVQVTVEATKDFKTVLRYAKLAHLLHEIERTGPTAYRLKLTGPATVLRKTRCYGVNFARFVPALLACKGWRMTAEVQTPWPGSAKLILSEKDGFNSHLPAVEEFDLKVEESLAEKFGEKREGWTLIREGAILHEDQKTFVPDFVFRHEGGPKFCWKSWDSGRLNIWLKSEIRCSVLENTT